MAGRKAPDDGLSDSDRAAIEHARESLQEKQHRQWLWRLLGRVSKWALAVIAGTTVVIDAGLRLWRSIHGP